MNVQTLAKVFGIVFILVGVLGFVPGITTEDGHLLGLFEVNLMHNIVHLVSGLAALWAMSSVSRSVLYFKVFGVIYALVTVLGFISGSALGIGLIPVNHADNLLHIAITLVALYAGFFGGKTVPAPPSMQEHTAPTTNPNLNSSLDQDRNQNSGMM